MTRSLFAPTIVAPCDKDQRLSVPLQWSISVETTIFSILAAANWQRPGCSGRCAAVAEQPPVAGVVRRMGVEAAVWEVSILERTTHVFTG